MKGTTEENKNVEEPINKQEKEEMKTTKVEEEITEEKTNQMKEEAHR